jgi:hypothetical protein
MGGGDSAAKKTDAYVPPSVVQIDVMDLTERGFNRMPIAPKVSV